MQRAGNRHWALAVASALWLMVCAGTVAAPSPPGDGPAQWLDQAEYVSTSDQATYVALLKRLENVRATLAPEQQRRLDYLQGWQLAYEGRYDKAAAKLQQVIDGSSNTLLRLRADSTLVNILAISSRYEDAFARLGELNALIPQVADRSARAQALGVAGILYIQAGQYELASGYADRMVEEDPTSRVRCRSAYLKAWGTYLKQAPTSVPAGFGQSTDLCEKAREPIFANFIRSFAAGILLQQKQPEAAAKLLGGAYAEVRNTHYPRLVSQFDAQLAEAYLDEGDLARASHYALAAVAGGVEKEYTEPLVNAYRLLFEIEKQRGHAQAALAYHEKYMTADKGYLTDVSAKALAFQLVNQQVQVKKAQIDGLSKRNQILRLQQALDRKAMENSRLYIALLLTVLAFIGFLLYRLKRSQLRFMRLAQCDGLTGIFNRGHFIGQTEQALRSARKSARHACLILIDLDHFKLINDTYGHAVGDHVLQCVVAVCRQHLRATEVFGRLGGEEFGILLPDHAIGQGIDRAEEIRKAIAAIPHQDATGGFVISASFGVACTEAFGCDLGPLLVQADHALYRAKRGGRNRVVAGALQEELAIA